jgi:hypothetical protein
LSEGKIAQTLEILFFESRPVFLWNAEDRLVVGKSRGSLFASSLLHTKEALAERVRRLEAAPTGEASQSDA